MTDYSTLDPYFAAFLLCDTSLRDEPFGIRYLGCRQVDGSLRFCFTDGDQHCSDLLGAFLSEDRQVNLYAYRKALDRLRNDLKVAKWKVRNAR